MRFHRSRSIILPELVALAGWALLAGTSCVQGPDGKFTSALDVCALASDGSLCDDRQPCTVDDVCLNKKCVGTPAVDGRPCTDGNLCTGPDQCMRGVCVGAALADGTACDDDEPCTNPDTCQLGICRAGPALVCDDHDSCTTDSCVLGVGCVFAPRECAVVDAGPDVMTPVDVRPDVSADLSVDLAMDLPRDLPPDVSAPDAVDAVVEGGLPDVAPGDGQMPDVGGPGDAPVDEGVDMGTGFDAGTDAGEDAAEAGVDAGTDAGQDVRDASGADLMETPPDFRARGGGCDCTVGSEGGGGRGARVALVALGMVVVARRRRKPRR